jgi:hypothetical protein
VCRPRTAFHKILPEITSRKRQAISDKQHEITIYEDEEEAGFSHMENSPWGEGKCDAKTAANTNATNKVTMYERRQGHPNGDVILNGSLPFCVG